MASQNPSSDKAEIISAIMGKAEVNKHLHKYWMWNFQVDSPVLSVKSLDENVDVHGLPVKSYLEQTVVPVLIEGLTALSRER